MSILKMAEVFSLQEISGHEKLVMLALADNSNDQGICWPSLETIARKASVAERSARRLIRQLTDRGFLEVEINTSGKRKGNIYHLKVGAQPRTESPPSLDLVPPRGDSGGKKGGLRSPPNLKRTTIKKECDSDSSKKGSRLSENWTLPKPWEEWAVQQSLTEQQVRSQADQFRDYWIGVPGAKGIKLNWKATWRNRIRGVLERGTYINGGPSVRPDPMTASDHIMRELNLDGKGKTR